MGGGLMQLVAYGAQDIYLTGNPQITFFKVVYRRHTNFSMESIQQTWNGNADALDGRCTSTISRNGDLVHKMYIQVETTGTIAKINGGADWIKTATLEIGGQQIDKITGQWMEVWSELTEPNPTGASLNGSSNGTLFQNMSGFGGVLNGQSVSASNVYVPLPFWFCRNPGLALPLIALQYHEVKLVLEHGSRTSIDSGCTQNLWVDYIYLDTDERRRFAQVSHEYLIEQLQYQQMTDANQRLNFNHPVKELVWCNASTAAGSIAHAQLLQNASAILSTTTWQLKLNGHDRFAARPTTYFTRQQVYDYHSGHGGVDTAADYSSVYDSIFVYSFALKPEEHQPSGTCNFSRIDNAELKCTSTNFNKTNSAWTVYAVNYNVLRIMSGMGGLAYSN
jgi:hypothetical protein